MFNRHEDPRFDEREWACVTLQAPLGTVVLARRLPLAARAGGPAIPANRRSASSNPPGSTTKRLRIRRSL